MILQRPGHLPHFKAMKYETPHSKTSETPSLAATTGQIALHSKALKCYRFYNFKVGHFLIRALRIEVKRWEEEEFYGRVMLVFQKKGAKKG
jgi:hypothetical protein